MSAALTSSALADLFATHARAVGAEVSFVAWPALVELLVGLLPAATGPVLVADDVDALAPDLRAALRRHDVDVAQAAAPPQALAAAGAAVSLAAFGVAETGSVALASPEWHERLSSMLPPVHVVLLPADRLVPGLDAVGDWLRAATTRQPPLRYASLVTGPSRTADIERVLTIGVQGPRVLHVLLVGDDGAGAT